MAPQGGRQISVSGNCEVGESEEREIRVCMCSGFLPLLDGSAVNLDGPVLVGVCSRSSRVELQTSSHPFLT
eukprot:9280044-Pyramimonas_sp.AAC.1